MTKHLKAWSILLLLFSAINAAAQTHVGFTVGAFNAHHTDETSYFNKASDYGYTGGVFIEQNFFNGKIAIELDAIIFRYGSHISSTEVFVTEYGMQKEYGYLGANPKIHGTAFPLIFKFNYNQWHPFLGVEYEVISNSKTEYTGNTLIRQRNSDNSIAWTYENKSTISLMNHDYGFLAGLEYDINQTIGVRLTYFRGMTDVVRYDFTTGILNGEGGTKFSESTRKETFSLNVVYTPQWRNFKLKKETEPKEKIPLKDRIKEMY